MSTEENSTEQVSRSSNTKDDDPELSLPKYNVDNLTQEVLGISLEDKGKDFDDITQEVQGKGKGKVQYLIEETTSSERTSEERKSKEGASLTERSASEKLKLTASSEKKKQVAGKSQLLSDLSLDGIVDYIKSGSARNIVTMVGAGISTSAGIPDFRTPGTGLYDNLQKYNLPYSQAIFELGYFILNPEPFFTLAKELMPGSSKPTKSHHFIKLLLQKNVLLRHYTQNIDNLERQAGISEEYLIEAHGTYYYSHCISCRKEYSFEWMKRELDMHKIPKCESCDGIVKPDIVFFGETLPEKFYKNVRKDFDKCDLLIIMGSSMAVEPFASLCTRVNSSCPRLLVNNEAVGEELGLKYDQPGNYRDVAWIGDCDAFCDIFVNKLGWNAEYQKLLGQKTDK